MSRLEELIESLCPDGVEHHSLGSLMTRVTERAKHNPDIKQVYVVSSTLGLVRSEEYRDRALYSDDTSNYIVVRPGMFAYNPARLNIGSIGLMRGEDAGLVSPMYVVFSVDKSLMLEGYLMHVMKSSYVSHKINSLTEEAARFRFDYSRWNKIEISVPPLEVQAEIVRKLDKFTELISLLERELDLRLKQYEYYRDKLLTFGDDVKRKAISEVCTLSAGGDIPKGRFSRERTEIYTVPVISNGVGDKALQGYTDTPAVTHPAVTVSARGTIGYSSLRTEPFYPIVRLIVLTPHDELLPGFLKYAIEMIKFIIPRSGIPQLTIPMISKYTIPVPPLEVQQKIVNTLDKFTGLISLVEQELAARRKQYAHYRDKLLTFRAKVL